MNTFLHDDGTGRLHDDTGNEVAVLDMEVDDDLFPLGEITEYRQYLDLKPTEKAPKQRKAPKREIIEASPSQIATDKGGNPGTYRSYKDEDKEALFFLIYEKGCSVRSAASKLNIPPTTARNWLKKEEENNNVEVTGRKPGSGRPAGRPTVFNDEHKGYLTELIDNKPDIVLDEMMESLTTQFIDLDISKSGLHRFVTEKCNISLKRAHFHSVERNSPAKLEERYEWVKKWQDTDMDYMSNCVFVDEAAFHINMKRSFAWSKKGTRAVVQVPKTRARMTTILGAVSSLGVVNMRVKRPKAVAPQKKRKANGGVVNSANVKGRGGTVTGHYFNFIASTLDVMDQHDEFKGHYIIMDNAPIHTNKDIQLYIEGRGYGCIYLPPYSPELNPIEQFWSVCKSKLKRETLLSEETLTSRIQDACNRVLLSDLKGFCRYSVSKFSDCIERKPL